MKEMLILVNEKDEQIGTEEKIKVHENGGKIHRAFSIFIFNSKGEMLIQQRANTKHSFAGLWSNTVCSHPCPGEDTKESAHKKLKQEFGFDTQLRELFSFIYKAEDSKTKLTEWEFDHVFIGMFDGNPEPNPEEINEFNWIDVEALKKDIANHPEKYTPWFRIIFERLLKER